LSAVLRSENAQMKDTDRQPGSNADLIFRSLPNHVRDSLIAQGIGKEWKKGETIFHRGDAGTFIILIQSGIAEVSVTSLNGRKSVLNHMRENEVLGEIALLDGGNRSADVVAHTDLTGVVLQHQKLTDFLQDNPKACFAIIEQLCSKVRNASDMFETHAMTSANARLARCLLSFDRKWGRDGDDGARVITQKFSQSDLGEFSGLARENVNRYITAWSRDNLLNFDKGQITLHDLARLKDIAEL